LGVEHWAIGRTESDGSSPGYRSSYPDLRLALRGARSVIHVASRSTPALGEKDPRLELENIRLMIDLLVASRAEGIGKIVFASSGGTVYGETGGIPAIESMLPRPSCSYAAAKLACEHYLGISARLGGISSIVLRISNLYGGSQVVKGDQGVVGFLVKRIPSGEVFRLYGDTIRDYIHVDDVSDAFMLALAADGGGQEVINISSGQGTSLLGLVGLISTHCGREARYILDARRPFDLQYSVLCNDRARDRLGWRPGIELTEGIIRTLRDTGSLPAEGP
jgi:UDP-glucose 4-epimerase